MIDRPKEVFEISVNYPLPAILDFFPHLAQGVMC